MNLPNPVTSPRIYAPRLHKAMELCLHLIVGATALAYPLCLSDNGLAAVHQSLSATPLFRELLPWISCGISPLVLKESMLLTLVAALLFVFSWIKIKGQYLGLEKSALGPDYLRPKSWLPKPEAWAFLLLIYFAITLFWSATFQQGLHTWTLMAAGAAVFLVVRSLPTGGSFVVRFMAMCVLCGIVLAVLALMQRVGNAPFLPESLDPRNRMSSLIGHNTGLSSWLMFPLSFSIYFTMTNRRTWVRAITAAFVLLFVAVITAAESRAIWVLGLILCVVLPWKLLRAGRMQMTFRFALMTLLSWSVAALLLIGVLNHFSRSGPMAGLRTSVAERFSDHVFNIDQLRRETRIRILAVSLTELVPRNPVFGTGLGSFGWEYPKAQGDYFASNPESRLGTTTRRTDLAHNDYLQVMVETGIMGFALLIGGLFAFMRNSIKGYRAMSVARHRALWWTLTAPGAAVALHALVDFPFHVAPIAIVAIVSLSLATRLSGGDLGLEGGEVPAAFPISVQLSRKGSIVGLIVTMIIFVWLPWGWQAMVGRVVVSDVHYNSGVHWLGKYLEGTGQNPQWRLTMLDRAGRSFREAVVNNLFNGEAYEGQATAYVNRGSFVLNELQSNRTEQLDSSTTVTLAMEMSIIRDAQGAIAVTENQLQSGGPRYHFTWYLLGKAWRLQWELEKHGGQPKDFKSYNNAVAALRKAVYYNPADTASARELEDLLVTAAPLLENRIK